MNILLARYEAHLYTGHLTLLSTAHCQYEDEADVPSMSSNLPIIIHFSDGNCSVESHCTCDSLFMLLTNNNEFQWVLQVLDKEIFTKIIQYDEMFMQMFIQYDKNDFWWC